jgi:hypothetical protein
LQIPRKVPQPKRTSSPQSPYPNYLMRTTVRTMNLPRIKRPRVSSDVTLALWYVVLGAACLAIWTILILGVV